MASGNGRSGSNRGGHGKSSGKARSVGAAAASGNPNGAILNDNDVEIQQQQRFKAWAKGYRDAKLKPNKFESLYPCPVDWK